jgi:hypothetical protein
MALIASERNKKCTADFHTTKKSLEYNSLFNAIVQCQEWREKELTIVEIREMTQ